MNNVRISKEVTSVRRSKQYEITNNRSNSSKSSLNRTSYEEDIVYLKERSIRYKRQE